MAIAAIHDWLRVRGTYSRGIELLKLHCTLTKAQEFFFSLPESQPGMTKLRAALDAVNKTATVQMEQSAERKFVRASTAPSNAHQEAFRRTTRAQAPTDLPEATLPVQLRQLRRDLTRYHTTWAFMRGRMLSMPDGMDLKGVAAQVINMDRKKAAGWIVLETWRATGEIVNIAPPAPTHEESRSGLIKARQRIRTWLSQRNPDAPNRRPATDDQLAAKRNELEHIERKINDATSNN